MKLITVFVPEPWLKLLDSLIGTVGPNRAEIIRLAIRDLLKSERIFSLKEKERKSSE